MYGPEVGHAQINQTVPPPLQNLRNRVTSKRSSKEKKNLSKAEGHVNDDEEDDTDDTDDEFQGTGLALTLAARTGCDGSGKAFDRRAPSSKTGTASSGLQQQTLSCLLQRGSSGGRNLASAASNGLLASDHRRFSADGAGTDPRTANRSSRFLSLQGGCYSGGLGLLQEDEMFPVQDDADEDLLAELMGGKGEVNLSEDLKDMDDPESDVKARSSPKGHVSS